MNNVQDNMSGKFIFCHSLMYTNYYIARQFMNSYKKTYSCRQVKCKIPFDSDIMI